MYIGNSLASCLQVQVQTRAQRWSAIVGTILSPVTGPMVGASRSAPSRQGRTRQIPPCPLGTMSLTSSRPETNVLCRLGLVTQPSGPRNGPFLRTVR